MGSFNESCGFSGLPITYKAKVRMMAIRYAGDRAGRSSLMTSPLRLYEPVSLLVRGRYNDYGWITFDKGEEERFFASVQSMGINLVKRENSSGVDLPANVFLWFILEDAFQLADEMAVEWFVEDTFKNIPIKATRPAAFKDWRALREIEREHFAKVMAQTADDESYDRQINAEETAKRHLSGDHYNLRTALMIDARRAKEDTVAEQALADLFDLERVTFGLYCICRPLTPVMSGGQGYDDAAHKLLASFVTARVEN